MSKYAIFKHGGKQYRVSEGEYLKLDHFSAEAKSSVEITDVLCVNDGEVKVGAPFVKGAKVVLEVVNEGKDKKSRYLQKTQTQRLKTKTRF